MDSEPSVFEVGMGSGASEVHVREARGDRTIGGRKRDRLVTAFAATGLSRIPLGFCLFALQFLQQGLHGLIRGVGTLRDSDCGLNSGSKLSHALIHGIPGNARAKVVAGWTSPQRLYILSDKPLQSVGI